MKIAILSPFYPYRGGLAQLAERFYQELVKNNEVKVFSYTTLYPKLLFPGKTQFLEGAEEDPDLPSERVLSTTNPFSYRTTAKAINDYDPDIVIVAYWMTYLAVPLSAVCGGLKKSIKRVGFIHNAIPHERTWFDKPLSTLFFNNCDAFICMSEAVHKDLKQVFGIQKPILVKDHPIYDRYAPKTDRSEACDKLGLDSNKKIILFFGLIRAYKGLDLLIEAMGKLDSSYQLAIAGECYGSFDSYQQLINLSKNKNNIKVWNEYISDDRVPLFFSVADVLALPYRSATQSGVIAMAYHMETPMIATNVGALGEVISRSGTGLVIPDISAESIAQTIELFFKEDHTSYTENLQKEKTRLSWSNFTQSVESFISEL